MFGTKETCWVLKTVNYSLVPNRRAGGWQKSQGTWKNHQNIISGGIEGARGGRWEFLPKCNSQGIEIRMPWLEKNWKINQCWRGTFIRHQRVHAYFYLSLWEDSLILLSLSVRNYCDSFSSWTVLQRLKLNWTVSIQTNHGLEKYLSKSN